MKFSSIIKINEIKLKKKEIQLGSIFISANFINFFFFSLQKKTEIFLEIVSKKKFLKKIQIKLKIFQISKLFYFFSKNFQNFKFFKFKSKKFSNSKFSKFKIFIFKKFSNSKFPIPKIFMSEAKKITKIPEKIEKNFGLKNFKNFKNSIFGMKKMKKKIW